jgi:hypothetical protein
MQTYGNIEKSNPTRTERHVRMYDLSERSNRAKNDGAKHQKVVKLRQRREARKVSEARWMWPDNQ